MMRVITEAIGASLLTLLRETAQAEILPFFRRLEAHNINTKTDDSDLVTTADRATERRIADGVAQRLPKASVIGEEAVSETPSLLEKVATSELCAIIDPIDGTWNFARGLPLFGVMLAIVENGRTTFGLIYDPLTDTALFALEGSGATMEFSDGMRRRLTINPKAEGTVGFVPIHSIPRTQRHHMTPLLERYDRILSFHCSAHEYWMMGTGATDFCLSTRLKPWDHAAGELIYREAGGYAAMLEDGTPYAPAKTQGHLLCARSQAHWNDVHDNFTFLYER